MRNTPAALLGVAATLALSGGLAGAQTTYCSGGGTASSPANCPAGGGISIQGQVVHSASDNGGHPISSTLSISGAPGTVKTISVTLLGLTFNGQNSNSNAIYPASFVLQSPSGAKFLLLSQTGTSSDTLSGANVTLQDGAAAAPGWGANSSDTDTGWTSGGTFAPGSYWLLPAGNVSGGVSALPSELQSLSLPATDGANPSGTYGAGGYSTLNGTFAGGGANNNWTLTIYNDDNGGRLDPISITGWALTMTFNIVASDSTSTTIASGTANPAPLATNITYTATVKDTTHTSTTVNSGTVTFKSNGSAISCKSGSNTTVSGGTATCITSFASQGLYDVSASYGGDTTISPQLQSSSSTNDAFQIVENATTHPNSTTWCNTGGFTVPGETVGSVYPSVISISGSSQTVLNVEVQLLGMSGDFFDTRHMLAGPKGTNTSLVFLENAFGFGPYSSMNLNFLDGAASASGGTPSNNTNWEATVFNNGEPLTFDTASAPNYDSSIPQVPATFKYAQPVGTNTFTSSFTGISPNGDWALYAENPLTVSTETIGGGWCLNFTLGTPPAITSTNTATFTVGTNGSFQMTATGSPTPTFSVISGSTPSGVTLSSAGLLSGTPGANTGGQYTLDIQAANGVTPNATQTFTLNVHQAPAITNANSTTFTVGSNGSFQMTASGFPAPTFSLAGTLPSGVTMTTGGLLSGTPAAGTGGSYPVTITALNGTSPNATQSFTLTVDQAPAFTSANNTTFTVGQLGSFSVAASGDPAPTYSETGSLPGLVTLTTSGLLSGTPNAGTGGTYPITITASNGIGTNATQGFTLTVDQAPAFTSANSTAFTVGSNGSFQMTASGFPAPTFSLVGTLPSGVTMTTGGLLSGTPASGTGGSYPFTVNALNGTSPNASQSFTLTVNAAATATAAGSASTLFSTSAQSVQLSATVTSNSSAVTLGTVTFEILQGPTLIGTATSGSVNGSGVATVLYSLPAGQAAGSYTIQASYNANASYSTSADSTQSLTVLAFTPTITWNPAGTIIVGSAGTFNVLNASVNCTSCGTISYTAQPTGGPVSSISNTTSLAAGTYNIGANFTPGSSNYSSTHQILPLTISGQSVWVVNGGGGTSELAGNGAAITSSTYPGANAAVAIDSTGDVWSVGTGTTLLETTSQTGNVQFSVSSVAGTGGLNAPSAVAVDGSSQGWIANGNGSVSLFNVVGTPLSPSTGFTDGSLSTPSGVAVDLGGSVWVSNQGNNSVTRFLGAGVPVAPLSTAAANNTTGSKP